ncbi:MAG: signal peptide peptidase SppA [Gemmatimonadaceae bacterium]|nr:signal peptide peptidase SppA [Chitinophagaceae bacterium]
MVQFIKVFFASLLALIVFSFLAILVIVGWVGAITSSDRPETGAKAVLYLDLSQPIMEQSVENPLADFQPETQSDLPGLYDLVRMIHHAKSDSAVKGIYIRCASNANDLATSDELRDAILEFRKSKKFVFAYGDVISQGAYYVANTAERVYCNPVGGLEWKGFSMQYVFFKKTLEKLEIEPQIFYAGKFKSATEPLREEQMTEANRYQSMILLNDLYGRFLTQTSAARNIDTGSLRLWANEMAIRTAKDAVNYKLIDGALYDDQLRDEIKNRLGLGNSDKINFITPGKYSKAVSYKQSGGDGRIALIYAQGDIVDGRGGNGQIGGDTYRNLIRKAATDKAVKAIVIRINSGGGSAMASENMWREIEVAKKEKPVVVSFGDYAASGGYYMACGADSIFTRPNTLTGSIGVFAIIPNMKNLLNNKLGISVDGVKTGPYADIGSIHRPLTATERMFFQNDIDSIYATFLRRVSDGRKISYAFADSIAQGRVWTGERAIGLGLADKIGGLHEAVACAARMAKLSKYSIREFPEAQSWWESIMSDYKTKAQSSASEAIRAEFGDDGVKMFYSFKKLRQVFGNAQTKMPFDIRFEF